MLYHYHNYRYYEGADAATHFISLLMRKEPEFFDIIEENVKMKMTEEDREAFEAAAYCSECNGKFGPSDHKVRDHDHHTGEYRSALCNFCNLQKKNLLFINLYCHNMTGFDSHLLIKALDMESAQFSILSKNMEQIITMKVGRYRIIDSSSFMPQSLETLTTNLKAKGVEHFLQTKKLARHSEVKLDLLTQKGVYPYEFMDSMDRLLDTKLPEKHDFYSSLKDSHISTEDHQRAQVVWDTFKCKTLSDYTRLYCRSDTYLLADCWKNFCDIASSHLKLHPEAGYVTLPTFASDCQKLMMYQEGGGVMTLIDETKKQFSDDIIKGVRGGSCMIRQKADFDDHMEDLLMSYANEDEKKKYQSIKLKMKAQAREKSRELREKAQLGTSLKRCSSRGCVNYVSGKGRRCREHAPRTLLALDFNNLYGQAMCFRLPLDGFEVVSDRDLAKHQLKFDQIREKLSAEGHYSENSETGYIFCADLEFPVAAQKKLLAFPLAPEGMIVEENLLSQGQKEIWSSLFKKPYYTTTHMKMVNSFSRKKGYTSHYQYLKFLATLGVKIRLKRGYMFRQKKFISSYVKYCAQQRKLSTNPADKQMWKDLCNIIFGMPATNNLTTSHYLITVCSFQKSPH